MKRCSCSSRATEAHGSSKRLLGNPVFQDDNKMKYRIGGTMEALFQAIVHDGNTIPESARYARIYATDIPIRHEVEGQSVPETLRIYGKIVPARQILVLHEVAKNTGILNEHE